MASATFRNPNAINYCKTEESPAAVLTDVDGNPIGVTGNPLVISAVLIATSNLSIGVTGAAVPPDTTQVGGEDALGNLQAVRILTAAPGAGERGLVTRNIPSGTQAVSAPGGAALALDSTLTSGAARAVIAGSGVAGVPAAGVVTVQGIAGGTPIPVSGTFTDPAEGLTGAATPATAIQVAGFDGAGNLRAVQVLAVAPAGAEQGFVVRNIPSGTQTISGTVTANQGTPNGVAAAWPMLITDGVDTVLVTAAGGLTVDGSAVTQPVSAPGGGALALDATITGGTARSIVRGGAKGATAAADVTSTAEGADHQGLDVQIYSGGVAINPTQIRALTAADVVTAQAQPGVDIGDVTINNAAGAAAVNIQDGGNSITVDGSVAVNNAAGAAAVNIQDGGNSITVDGSVTAIAQPGVDIGDVTVNNAAGAAAVNIQDGGNSITVDTPQLPAALVGGRLDVNIGAGTVTITPSGTLAVEGTKTNNAAVPGANNVGVLPAVANAADPVRTEGNLGVLRTTLAGDLAITLAGEAVVLGAGAAIIGSLTANQSVNVAQMNGTTVSMNTGVRDAGTQRVTIATNDVVPVSDNGGSLTVDGTVSLGAGAAAIGSVTVSNAAGASAVNIQDGGNSITVDGTVTITPSGTQTVEGNKTNNAAAPGANNLGVFPAVANAAAPTQVEGRLVALRATLSGDLAVTLDGESVAITAAALPLPAGAATAALQTQPGVDIGDVTVNNAAGAAAVNIQDGGNSITVDGSVTAIAQPGVDIGDVTINNAAGAAAVNIQDGGNSITVDGSVTAIAQPGVDIGDVTVNNAAGAAAVNIQDGGNSITVDGSVTVAGSKSNNTAAPGATNVGTLPAVATVAAPTYIEGNQVALSTDLTGALRITGSISATNPSVGLTGAAAPTSATEIGGVDGAGLLQSAQVLATAPVGTERGIVTRNICVDASASEALGALDAVVSVALTCHQSVGMQLSAGTLVGRIVPEISLDGGTTWAATFFDDSVTNAKVAALDFTTPNDAVTRTIVGAGGASNARVRVSLYTSGTANVAVRATDIADPSVLYSGQSASNTRPPTVVQLGGFAAGTLTAVSVDKDGTVAVGGPLQASQQEILTLILVELRVITQFLGQGLNVKDDPSHMRKDPNILSLN